MNRPLRIAIAEDEPKMREFLIEVLPRIGHEVLCAAKTGKELVDFCRSQKPDLLITDIKMPDMDGIAAAAECYSDGPVPVILVSAFHDPELIGRAERNHILAYLVKPIKQKDLEPAISIAMARFEHFQALREEAADLKQALHDRKLIERAKGILMRKTGLDEETAFRQMQKLASSKQRKLVDIAQGIVDAEELYNTSGAAPQS